MTVPLHCLQIEDSESDAALVFRLLKKAKFDVRGERVESARDLRDALSRQHWDVIIADYHLPGFDAYKALSILQETGLDIPFIGVSGKVGNEIADEIMRRGAADYVTKDALERLVPAIRRELREAEMRRKHKNTEMALKLERERFISTMRRLGEAVITTDNKGFIVAMNPAAEQLTGRKSDKATGLSLGKVLCFYSCDTRKPRPNPILKALKSGFHEESKNVILATKQAGYEKNIAYSAMPFKSSSGETVGAVLVCRETAEEDRHNDNLLSSNRLKSIGVVASEIAHDFSNFLSIIMGNIELGQEYCRRKNLDKAIERLDSVLKTFQNAKDLSCRLISLSHGCKPTLKLVPVGPIIYRESSKTLANSNITITTDLPEDLWECSIDESQFRLAFDNILTNAKQFMTTGGSISIKAENLSSTTENIPAQISGNVLKISFRATSTSLESDQLPCIIDPFEMPRKCTETSLEICSLTSIIKQHGGFLKIEPDAAGITYFIYLPAHIA